MAVKFSQQNYQKRLKSFFEKEEVKAYSMVILSFFALSFFTLFAIKPTLSTLFNLKRQIADSSEVDKKLEEKINTLLEAQQELQKHEENVYLISEALPEDPQFTSLIRQIENLAAEYSATISALQVEGFSFYQKASQRENTEVEPKSFDFAVSISSSYPQGEAFLQKLMNLRRIINLKDLEIFRNQQEEGVTFSLKGRAYYLDKL